MLLKLADGKEYEVRPLTLGALEKLQPLIKRVYGKDNDIDVTNPDIFGDIIGICSAILNKTNEESKELVDIKNIKDVFAAGFGAEEPKEI